MPTVLRVLLIPAYGVVGAVTAIASVALHPYWWGLALGVAAPAVTMAALAPGWGRLPFALGWIAMLAYLTIPRPEGDFVVGDDTSGYTLIAAAMAFLVASLVTLPRRVRSEPPGPVS